MKSARVIREFRYDGVALWHGTHKARPFDTSKRNSGNSEKGLMWSACSFPPRVPQPWQVKSSRAKTASRHDRYSELCRTRIFSGVIPPFHLGCSSGARDISRARKRSEGPRISTPIARRRFPTHTLDSPISRPIWRSLTPLLYKASIKVSSTTLLFDGGWPGLNSVPIERRFPRLAARFFSLAASVWRLPFIGLGKPLWYSRLRSRTSGLFERSFAAQGWHMRFKESDRTLSFVPHPRHVRSRYLRWLTSLAYMEKHKGSSGTVTTIAAA